MFNNIAELVNLAETQNKKIYEIMLEQEMKATGFSKDEIINKMKENYTVMKAAIEKGMQGVTSKSGMTGGDAKRLSAYRNSGNYLTDYTLISAICYAVATNEVNASMGLICATPTAGSSGVLPAVMFAAQEKLQAEEEVVINHLFTAGAIGYIIANNASISGAAGGCQAEVGSASAMAAAAVTEMAGGTPSQAAHAMAMALKNMLGLSCDPVAGLVEVPCIKRNAAGAVNAFAAAEMALAGVESRIPWDEVISAMYRIGLSMPIALKETALGGLAATETGKCWREKIQ
ncbi:L-serine ammonia-lyase, iron-sulfur-dependent, subunit alpha [Anaerocolumna aminovalerica]|uniref:L-serine ammonia-lyase, iron-sulfur-dependent, subunit alpha n=1 Tax=Anaerocolumna aminovalerica TaxID=1527 RepID=UPI00248B868E|nr:L-serine ammonia-lyase, iron-sulfur-dependent, subunit alpha [Anaerocolumna aminovalerica]